MKSLVEILGKEAETAFLGLGVAIVVSILVSGLYLNSLDEIDFLIIAGFAILTAITLASTFNYRRKWLASVHEFEQLRQTVCKVVQTNG